jgi:phage shock protein A
MKARYEAAEASARVSEAMTGAGDEMDDVARSIERATERTEKMEARAAAMDELQDSGALEDAVSEKDAIDRELEELRTDREIDAELDTLKSDVEGESGTESERGSDGESADDDATADAPEVDETEVEAELEELREEER